MSKGVKVLLIVLGLCVLGLVGLGVAGYLWFEANKEDLKQGFEQIQAEAEAFAANTDQHGCMTEARRRVGACGSFGPICEAKVQGFLTLCLEDARAVPDFCEGVPSKADILESAMWANGQCVADEDADATSRCARLHQAKQTYCDTRSAKGGRRPPEAGGP